MTAVIQPHVRESATPTDLLGEPYPSGLLLADCSCGGVYIAPAGGEEFAALEKAHARHIADTAEEQ
jgi:hypothetical protein